MILPSKPGFYWAKFQRGDEGTPHDVIRNEWEVVEVYEAAQNIHRVFVSGIEQSQSLENFDWGENPLPIPLPLAPDRGDGRKAHYGAGRQPWDDILDSGWAPAFAAGSILKYLRRDKSPEHSVESARWYYARVIEGAASEIERPFTKALTALEALLTVDEIKRLRGVVS